MAQGRDSGWRAFCQKGLGSEGSWPEDNTTLARSTHHCICSALLSTAVPALRKWHNFMYDNIDKLSVFNFGQYYQVLDLLPHNLRAATS